MLSNKHSSEFLTLFVNQMRAEFERLAAKQAQKRMEAKMPSRGVVETKISLFEAIQNRDVAAVEFVSLGVHHSLEV